LLQDLKHCAKNILGTTVEEFVELSEERSTGWKQHQREVFRPPRNRLLLSILIGAGAQVGAIVIVALITMSVRGYHYFELEDAQIALIFKQLLVYSSIIAGYCSTRVYKMWSGQNWLGCAIITSMVLPLTLTISLSIENSMRLIEDAISYSVLEMFYLPVVWMVGAAPMGVIGGYIGFKRTAIKNPFSVHAVEQKREYGFSTMHQLAMGFLASLVPYFSFAT
jgi:transmembrane 9 superfamily protein 2/4